MELLDTYEKHLRRDIKHLREVGADWNLIRNLELRLNLLREERREYNKSQETGSIQSFFV